MSTRREFLWGSLLLAGVTAGDLTLPGCASSVGTGGSMTNAIASFGWEILNLNGTGANVYFRAINDIVLTMVDIDVAFMITANPVTPGAAEIVCQGSVSRGSVPTFDNSGKHAYIGIVQSNDFGTVTLSNPNGLGLVFDPNLLQDKFFSIILKSWVPLDGTAAATYRHVSTQPSLRVNAGDYLVFHMDHLGVPGDVEMQVVLTYSI
jgi:hypothetical protein